MDIQIEGLVSVIIPTFNRGALCRRAVQSVLSQSYGHVEVIVVDDGSVDDTKQVITGLDDRVRYIWQSNAGVSAARNRGLECANGEFVAFLDSDDRWFPWKLQAQMAALKAFPAAGMVFTDMMAVDDNQVVKYQSYKARMFGAYEFFRPERHFRESKPIREVWTQCPSKWAERKCYAGNIFDWMFMGNLILTSSVLLRRSRQQAVGLFDVGLQKSGEDYDFHFRTCRLGDVAYMDVSAVEYRVGAHDQLTSNDLLIWIARNDLKTLRKMLSVSGKSLRWSHPVIRRRVARSYAWVGFEEFARDPRMATGYLWKSLVVWPFQLKAALFCLLSVLPQSITKALKTVKRELIG